MRPATVDDLEAIVALRLALLREYDDHPFYARLQPNVEARARELYRAQLAAPREVMFLAERGARPIGMLRCVETSSSPVLLPEKYCYVSSAFVVPAERHHGVLHALVAAAERWSEERGITEMRLHNSSRSAAARQAWDALGFEVVEEVRRRDTRPRVG